MTYYFKLFFRASGASTLLLLLPVRPRDGLLPHVSNSLPSLTFCCDAVTTSPVLCCDVITTSTRVLLRHHRRFILSTSRQRYCIWFRGLFPRNFLPRLALSEQCLCFVSENVLSEIDNGAKCY
ncbi:hypothetical protein AAZX31_03G088800 [Glycine max]